MEAPGVLVDFRAQGTLEPLVGILCAGEVGVADVEALVDVVGVDEPEGDGVRGVDADLPGGRFIDINSTQVVGDLAIARTLPLTTACASSAATSSPPTALPPASTTPALLATARSARSISPPAPPSPIRSIILSFY